MRVLVTGGTGFIGSNLVSQLVKDNHEVILTGIEGEHKPEGFRGKYLQPSFIGIDWDAIDKVDVVFHQAAINDTTLLDKMEMFRANVESSKALFNHVVDKGCKRIVYASSYKIKTT